MSQKCSDKRCVCVREEPSVYAFPEFNPDPKPSNLGRGGAKFPIRGEALVAFMPVRHPCPHAGEASGEVVSPTKGASPNTVWFLSPPAVRNESVGNQAPLLPALTG